MKHNDTQGAHAHWRDYAVSAGPLIAFVLIAVALFVWLVDPAPPSTLTISAGPRDSSFMAYANQYREILARNRIRLVVLPSEGSLENLHRLLDPNQKVDLALVAGGVGNGLDTSSLMSLGNMFYSPIIVAYRGPAATRLSALEGKRVAIGRPGSGTRVTALDLLKSSGIEPGGSTELLPLDGDAAVQAMLDGTIDAAILNSDSATRPAMLRLWHHPGISVMDFEQVESYTRLFPYLSEVDLTPGVLDLGRDEPDHTIHLISPTVQLVARQTLHPALSDLLVEAAQEVHGTAGILQHAGEFPNATVHDYRISSDAVRYYKSGKGFLYGELPFWLASVVDRMLVFLVPVIVLLFPAFRLVPAIYRWRVRSRIYRWYGSLIAIERRAYDNATETQRAQLLHELDDIEGAINRMKMPLAHADAFYVLREHVNFVRRRLGEGVQHAVSA
ncbi:TAXI family TRAP transporter solute-binding subunit [Pararobbsia silviterrae]|uniref:C4-dicarboxylate ABC transporter substrate-binding protein n=1 Tax=Pararobbsia silviterrae TaxID=1792498 RepID=A0A494XB00_9BURK|nr:TAXI family TRAP transporter solute-binding subunit [Pararobbsia silviterrae]RKP47700.1 C4-dicarboxylate ABC transporter substrate-binding protein [Pararobbsia silviterrae]